jgi:CheY-like chemotaxis protein
MDKTENAEFSFNGCKILIAEDNELNVDIAVSILKDMGASLVDAAPDGQAVIEAFSKAEPYYYDFVLMDIQMPRLDGRSATRCIRALNRPDALTIPIFALTSDSFAEDERLSLEAGMNGHFTKPADFKDIEKKIGKYMNTREGGIKIE